MTAPPVAHTAGKEMWVCVTGSGLLIHHHDGEPDHACRVSYTQRLYHDTASCASAPDLARRVAELEEALTDLLGWQAIAPEEVIAEARRVLAKGKK